MENKNSSSGSGIFTLLTGAAVGAALGVLFAPEKGTETRKVIYKTAKNYAPEIMNKVEDSIENISDWAGPVYEKANFMKKEEESSFLWPLLLAIPVGAALGILFAPAKGSETRQKLSDAALSGIDSISNLTGMAGEEEFVGQSQRGNSRRGQYAQ